MSEEKRTGGFRSLGEFLIATRKYLDGEARDSRTPTLRAVSSFLKNGRTRFFLSLWKTPLCGAELFGFLEILTH